MKKILFCIVSIVVAINLNAVTRSEMIEKKLGKLGISKEIIAETIKIDKEIPNVVSENNIEKTKNTISKMEKLLQKNEKNFIISEKLINMYNAVGKNDAEKLKNLKLYEKYNSHEASKLFYSNMYYSNKGDFDSFNKNYEKLKEKYPDYLLTRIAVTYAIGRDTIWEIMKNNEKVALASINSIMQMCDNKNKTEESNISDEEAWAYKLSIGWFAISYYLSENKVQEAIDFYVQNFRGKNTPSREIQDYNEKQNMYVLAELLKANEEKFSKNNKVFQENLKKLNIAIK